MNDQNPNHNSDPKADPEVDQDVAYSTFTPSRPTVSEYYASARAFDEVRPSFVGEHAMVCGAGAALLVLARTGRPFELRLLVGALAIALLARSASGRDGYWQKAKDALL